MVGRVGRANSIAFTGRREHMWMTLYAHPCLMYQHAAIPPHPQSPTSALLSPHSRRRVLDYGADREFFDAATSQIPLGAVSHWNKHKLSMWNP
jgi:hypothetical protein